MAFRYYSDHSVGTIGYKNAQESRDKLTFGTEIEFENNHRIQPRIGEYELSELFDQLGNGRTYCKQDGSLNNHGCELISEPGTLGHHMYVMRWRAILKAATKNGYRSHDTQNCGMHVHVGREQLGETDAQRAEVIRKVMAITQLFRPELTRFSRRRLSELQNWAPIPALPSYVDRSSGESLRDYFSGQRTYISDHGARYTAVNVTNRPTVEIRIFRGTAKRDTVIANLQLVNSMFTYAMTHSWDELAAASFADIALWEPYDEIVGYMKNRGLLAADAIIPTMPSSGRAPEFGGRDGVTAVA